MSGLVSILTDPVVALFVCLAAGYALGLLRVGPIQLGGVCGTLFVALLIGQLGVTIGDDLKNTAFALFIFALGFTAGPHFFTNLRSGWRYGILSFVEVISVLLLLFIATYFLRFDAGTLAGLFAGSATESAVIGTASEAVGRLDLPSGEVERLQSNIATAYSVTYLFGLVAIVIFTTQIAPLLLRINLRDEASALAKTYGADEDEEEDVAEGLPAMVGRAFRAGPVAGSTVQAFETRRKYSVTIERIKRGREIIETTPETVVESDDILFVLGRRNAVIGAQEHLGAEVPVPVNTNLPLLTRDIVLTRKEAYGARISELRKKTPTDLRRGVFIQRIRRLGRAVPALPGTILQHGDVLTLYGPERAVTRAATELGHVLPPTDKTDFIYLGLGIAAGLWLGSLNLRLGSLELTLGSGGGALVAGLVFGWLHIYLPRFGALPTAAANFIKEFGLAAFIAAIGLSAGPDAIKLIQQYGLILPVLGILVSALPALASLIIGKALLKIEAPILLGAIAGQHCSTPTISALVSNAGNSIPVIGYTVTYAISNVLLPLMGPVVVSMAVAVTTHL